MKSKNSVQQFRPLDFVRTPDGLIALVTEISECDHRYQAISLTYIGDVPAGTKVAWWGPEELVLIDSLPSVISRSLCNHNGRLAAEKYYPKVRKKVRRET